MGPTVADVPTIELTRASRRRSDLAAVDSSSSRRDAKGHSGSDPDVVAEANGIAALFASFRPCDGVSAAISRSGPTAFDANISATTWILEAGLKLLEPRERHRIVDSWSVPRRNRCSSLITDGGCEVRIGDKIESAFLLDLELPTPKR